MMDVVCRDCKCTDDSKRMIQDGHEWTHIKYEYCFRLLRDAFRVSLSRAEAAERRVAELEARLAEQEWRPVTEATPEAAATVELLVGGYRDEFGTWWYPDGDAPIKGWRPLPPPPAATEEPPQQEI